jgi:putative ABC transport system permease protein
LLFAAAIATASGILAGLLPALWITRSNQLNETLKEGGRSSGSGSHQTLRQWLLVGEVALAMMLLIETGLMVQSLRHLIEINPGSDPKSLLTARLELPKSKYPDAVAFNGFYSRLLSSSEDSSGAETLSVATNIPDGGFGNTREVIAEDSDPLQIRQHPTARVESVSPGYFASLRIPLLNGRLFQFRDGPDAAPVGLVSSALASRYWPGRDPIGRKVRVEGGKVAVTIVGVVKDVRYNWANPASDMTLYLPWAQAPQPAMFVLARTPNPTQAISAVRAAIARIDPVQPIAAIRTWDSVIADSILGISYVAVIMTLIGLLALGLASIGLFGLMSYAVRLQLREIGIRIALGARFPDVVKMVVGRAALLTGVGVSIGLAAGFGTAQLVSNLIVGTNSLDPESYGLAALLLVAAAGLASWIPARYATKIDPAGVLRES